MAEHIVADLDRRGREMQAALSGSSQDWSDSRRQTMDERYLHPHADAHDHLQSQLTSLLAVVANSRAAAGNAATAAAAATRDGEQAKHLLARASTGLGEARAAAQAARMAEASAAPGHDRTVELSDEAASIIP